MAVTFAQKLSRMPHYEAGMHEDAAREAFGSDEVVKLASNESPWGPHPDGTEAIVRDAPALNRYPDQHARRLRRRIAERFDTDPARVAVGHRSCEIRVPLGDGYLHDLGAMLDEITAATQLVCVCNPNNPTGTHIPASRIAEFCDRVPSHVTIALDEAYIEFQTNDDPDATVDLLADFPNLVVLRTFSKIYGLAGLRCGYALCSARFRGAVDAVRQPFSVNGLAQTAAAEAILHQDDVAQRVERTIVERVYVEEGVRELGLEPAESQANFIWIPLGDRDEGEVIRRLGETGIVVRGGEGLGGPGHIRVTYGTREENRRFLEALWAGVQRSQRNREQTLKGLPEP